MFENFVLIILDINIKCNISATQMVTLLCNWTGKASVFFCWKLEGASGSYHYTLSWKKKKNPDCSHPLSYLYLSPVFHWRYLSRHTARQLFKWHTTLIHVFINRFWLYFSRVSCLVPIIRTFSLLLSLLVFYSVRDTTDGADKFHSIAFFLPVQFFTEVRTNTDSTRC